MSVVPVTVGDNYSVILLTNHSILFIFQLLDIHPVSVYIVLFHQTFICSTGTALRAAAPTPLTAEQ